MGYADPQQTTGGIHIRQYSRAFIIVDENSGKRVCIVNVDVCMISQIVMLQVVQNLQSIYGDIYTEKNVLLSATHTHSGPGGFLQYFLYNIPDNGFVRQSFDAIVNGIVRVCIK
jgi:neutral ceramidase